MGWISQAGACSSLHVKLAGSADALAQGAIAAAANKLMAFLNELNAQRGKSVSEPAYSLLAADARSVLATLK